jgi:NAD(P)-dependent dehydrogenase (short-subunit alcohol dehydrogenase family)
VLLDGKVAIVTGAGQGIGLDYARGLAREGAAVTVAEINAETGKKAADQLVAEGAKAIFVETDVSSGESTNEMARRTAEEFGGVDILVNNAAIFYGLPFESIEEMPEERFDRVMAVNVKGVWLATRAVLPMMRARGGGVVINQSSVAAYLTNPNRLHYNVAKGAVITMTKALAKELGPDGVRVNAIAPGPVATEATLQGVPKELLEKLAETQCIKRMGDGDDMVGVLVFLASDMSKFMSGQVIIADGGLVMPG